eukprot:gnl/MRDRNA2_/MRDRNA2_90822_c0_seq1.p1 gnl/MRDRNA2_/MRDRNA2_90822_c0~~gnl/MRDRNA2_/MRDRNA2_90822_c0_seq1.p1  ORF type:complete len:647 (-),score=181.82 gnl/MRDRNA2_/MRDRNA2_90822_c0_seq1:45-1985(-)
MEFLAATKEGIIIYDALSALQKSDWEEDKSGNWENGKTVDGNFLTVVAKMPSPPNAFGYAWSLDGSYLASVAEDSVVVYNANDGYKECNKVPRVAPDVEGRVGGIRSLRLSPSSRYLVAYEKWDPVHPNNCHVWDIQETPSKNVHTCSLPGYSSGALDRELIKWTSDESTCIELVPGKGLVLRSEGFGQDDAVKPKVIAEKSCTMFQISPKHKKTDGFYVSCYIPEQGGLVARVAVYDIRKPDKATSDNYLPAKVKSADMLWNHEGSTMLILAHSDVDETGSSYFGTTYLYWVLADGSQKGKMISGAKEGLVQDITWSPTANEFAIIVGMLPATIAIYDGTSGKLSSTLGVSRRNTLKWNPFGRFLAVGGFGTLPGDIDFFDRSCEETMSSLRMALTVNCEWAPDGRYFLGCTVAPRMNEANQISIYKYNGERLCKIDYKDDKVQKRHEDTGAGARTKTQAILFAACWRPSKNADKYVDRPATPNGAGKRKKGLPDESESKTAVKAWAPRGGTGGYSGVAAMMRGEESIPEPTVSSSRWDTVETAKPMEEWEIKKLEKEKKKAAELKKKEEEEAAKQALKDMESEEKRQKKKVKELEAMLEELEKLKEKDWDELTEEDDAMLEKELDIRQEIEDIKKELEKGNSKA